jgi:hypothetical protein
MAVVVWGFVCLIEKYNTSITKIVFLNKTKFISLNTFGAKFMHWTKDRNREINLK